MEQYLTVNKTREYFPEQMSQMAGVMAHEINNPLAIIHGSAIQIKDLAQSGELDPALLIKIAERIEKTVFRISHVVKDLKGLSESRNSEPFEMVSLGMMIQEILSQNEKRFLASAAKIEVSGLQADLEIECRQTQLTQVVTTLLQYLIDLAGAAKSRRIKIFIEDQGNFVAMTLSDGVDSVEADYSASLSLAIVSKILELHQGSMIINSHSPTSRFIVRIPKRQSNG